MSEETQAMTVLYRKLTADDVAHLMNDPRSSAFCKGDQFKVRDQLQARVDQLTEQNRELLEALKTCLAYGATGPYQWVINQAQEAIRKATGEEA